LRKELEELEIPEKIKRIVEKLVKELERVLGGDFQLYLFGSYARGDWVEGMSDVDLMVISKEFGKIPKHARSPLIRRIASKEVSMEILCYTPEEFEELKKRSSFIREVTKYWIRIH